MLHILMYCEANTDLYNLWAARSDIDAARLDAQQTLNLLFAGRLGHPHPDGDKASARICFVGEAIQRVAEATTSVTRLAD